MKVNINRKVIFIVFAFNFITLMTSSSTRSFSDFYLCFIDRPSFHMKMSKIYQTNCRYDQINIFSSKLHQIFKLSLKFLCVWTCPKLGHHFQGLVDILGSMITAGRYKWDFEAYILIQYQHKPRGRSCFDAITHFHHIF